MDGGNGQRKEYLDCQCLISTNILFAHEYTTWYFATKIITGYYFETPQFNIYHFSR